MATEQVLSWINNDLTLSQAISNFETDFSNGYLLGEILSHYNQIQLNNFSKKKNKEAKVNNFYLVENALRKLNVKFDGKLIHQIMEEERGASLRLLYQLKLACQRLNVNQTDPEEFSMTNLKNTQVQKVLTLKQQATLEASKSIPPPTTGGKDIRTKKQISQDNRTLGFDVAQKTLFDNALSAHQKEMEFIKQLTQEQRVTNMTKLIENQTFMKDWTKEGIEKWKLNQKKRAEGIEKVKYFEDREVNIYKQKLNQELVTATAEEINGISDFQKNLQKLGIQQGISMDEAIKKQEEKKGIPPGQIQNFSYAATMNKIKETKKNTEFAGKERDRRRRKMIVDQQNAQTKLDQEAQEQNLIAKLLKQTNNEQRDAFIDVRMQKCKQNDFLMRQSVALTLEEKRKIQNEKAEERRKLAVKEVEAERARENEQRRVEVKKQAFEKKLVKRSLNIEIASGLVDLIMDLAEETYDVVSAREDHQIPNPEWRNFISIFKQGKKVSLRNVQQSITAVDSTQNLDSLQIAHDAQAHDVQKTFWHDPSLLNLYEYLSGIGAYNIPQLEPNMWHQYQDQYEVVDQESEGIPFIDVKMQQNSDLINLIDQLYKQTLQTANSEIKVKNSGLLLQPTVKISIIGRALSGKKTIAKQFQEVVGQDVTILNIDDVIKEAIEYINPKKQDESIVIDPKAKGKGKVAEPVNVDIFEGKNTSSYKAFAQQIKDQYFSGENLPRKVDLADLVLDDILLNGLVVERLKLLTEGRVSKGTDAIKAGVIREREIVKQLEELEAAAAIAAADPKAKNAKPAKGGPDPEKLNAELNEIRSFKATGWILIGYPKQLSQVKLLEQEITGYVSKIDQPKPELEEIRQSWRKLLIEDKDGVDSSILSIQQPVQSGFDAIFFLETPDSECQKRAKESTEEADNLKRIQTFNENYNIKVGSIKKWCEQFGLVDSQGVCKVTLNQEINTNEWDKKDSVKEQAIHNLKKLMAFKQAQFDSQRQHLKETVVDIAAESTINRSEKQTTPKREHTPKPDDNFKPTPPHSPSKTQIINDPSSILAGVHQLEESHIIKRTTSVGDKSSHDGGTFSKSSKRTKQVQQMRYEINDTQKINKWEEFLNNYYRNSLQRFNDLVKQRSRILTLFSGTQSNFISFICRESPFQKRVNEFCDNFNRFSEQYPELRGKEETKTELLKRVQILNDALWQTILDRKTQAVAESEKQNLLMENGWETQEKSRLVTFIVQLMEQEYERLKTIIQIVTGWVINQDVDMESYCEKLNERAIPTFQKRENEIVSPMLEQAISYLHSIVAQLFSEQSVQQQTMHVKSILFRERTNYHMRCNTLKTYALLLLIEINKNTEVITQAFEDWVITSVKKENSVCQNVVKQLRQAVQSDVNYLDSIKVQSVDYLSSIKKVQLEEGQPSYLTRAQISSPRSLDQTRLEISTLKLLFNQFQDHSQQELLDSQTFISIIIDSYQSYRLPQRWRNFSFQTIIELVNKFSEKPLTNVTQIGINPFALHSNSTSQRIQYVNWKKIFVLFSLAASALPSNERLESYATILNNFGNFISLEQFINVDAWFDSTESATTASQMIKVASSQFSNDDTQEEEIFDTQRLNELKTLLWRAIKRTNEEGMTVQDFIQVIKDIKQCCQGHEQTFSDILR